jgi:hypothetical protein
MNPGHVSGIQIMKFSGQLTDLSTHGRFRLGNRKNMKNEETALEKSKSKTTGHDCRALNLLSHFVDKVKCGMVKHLNSNLIASGLIVGNS